MSELDNRVIVPVDASHPEQGRWLWAMEDTRARTIHAVDGIGQDELDWVGPGVENSIGSLLYHIALIEFDYLYADILGEDYPHGAEETLLPFSDRDEDGDLSVVRGVKLADHLARLAEVRRQLLSRVSSLTAEEMETPRELPDYGYRITPAWTLHHLMQHEAEHRGQITAIRTLWAHADQTE